MEQNNQEDLEVQTQKLDTNPNAPTEDYFNGPKPESARPDLTQPISWQAPDGTMKQRGTGWYIAFSIVIIGLILAAIFIFKSITFAILLPVMATAVMLITVKPPQEINYSISPKGIYVGDRLYDFSEFKGFGIIMNPGHNSIILLPVKRFAPELTIHFSDEQGEKVVDMIGSRLPIQEIKQKSLDKLIDLMKL